MACSLDTENEIAVGKDNADRRTMQVGMRKVERGEGGKCKRMNSDIDMTNDTRGSLIQVCAMREVKHKDQSMERTRACSNHFH